ncbi:HAMP domain-containing sensor histidine kinase [Tuberibacillus sp. Marseille-P3662]|uniref:HAMP domain-containing sensor histidine kinase n=1 Tax=Tuberibacillus sp. Marseille-P3662 TaxID=1965358 RepID=UPI000A1C98EA|nr:sensor histidine kinase [Tuberibacillus sp. Marseille-P3662]
MGQKKLTNIQWRMLRFGLWIAVISALLTVGMIYSTHHLDPEFLLTGRWLLIPFAMWLLVIALVIGGISGYIYGNLLKKRLERLAESILKYERGDFTYRVPELGEDEIGMVAEHLNQMAVQIEKQVASLQKLSSEKAEWNEQMKKAAVTEERQRLARELHDAVSQQLFAISMMSSAILETADEQMDGQAAQQLGMIENMAGNAQNEMRALLLHLRPATLEGKGLKEGIEDLLTEFQAKQSLNMDWRINDIPRLTKGVEDHLFRIVQEGLSNVFRHSQAQKVSLRLHVLNRQLHLKIIDDGVGFYMDEQKRASYGLRSVQERAHEIGAVAEIVSFPDKGTQIEVKIPLLEQEGDGYD